MSEERNYGSQTGNSQGKGTTGQSGEQWNGQNTHSNQPQGNQSGPTGPWSQEGGQPFFQNPGFQQQNGGFQQQNGPRFTPPPGQPQNGPKPPGNRGFAPNPNQPGPKQNPPRATYYQAPQYARPGQRPVSIQPGRLSTTTATVALGFMFIAAALGVVTTINGDLGRGLLIGMGMCALIAGGVLAFSALKGLRPGWFLGVSIIGAALALPTLLVAAASTTYVNSAASTFETSVGSIESTDLFDAPMTDFDSTDLPWANEPLTYRDPSETYIDGYSSNTILDLSELDARQTNEYVIDLYDSHLQIVMRTDQVPVVWADSIMNSQITATSNDQGLFASFKGSVDSSALDFSGGRNMNEAAGVFKFSLLTVNSSVEFLFVDKDHSDPQSDDERQ